MTASEKMQTSSEKSEHPLYSLKLPFDEYNHQKQRKLCSKTLVTCVLAAILVGLCVVLTVEFLYPVEIKYKEQDVDEIRLYDRKNQPDSFEDKGPWHLDFRINPTRLCETINSPDSEAYIRDPEVKLLMLVPSATAHFAQRRAIRKTWGSVAQQPHGAVRLGFVLGTTSNSTETELIEAESIGYGDIIQADLEDTYRNLTAKSVLMLKWVSKYCAHAQYFLKADDDTFVNLHLIAQMLQREPYQSAADSAFVSGFIHRGAQPFREPTEKYFVSEEEFSGEEFPPYASGSAYLSTGNTASQLFEASKKARPFLPLEDIFVTGLCADDIDAVLMHEPSFLYRDPPKPITWDSYSPLATAHSVTPDDLEDIWHELTKSIFESFGLLGMDSLPNSKVISSSSSLSSDVLVFPNRNSGRGLFDSSDDSAIINKILSPPEVFISQTSAEGQPQQANAPSTSMATLSGSVGLFNLPESDIFNITFFLRK